MSNRITFPTKAVGETLFLTFSFVLAVGITISSANVDVAVYSGTDPSPLSLLSGAASISGANAQQKVTGGVVGNIYLVTCGIITSDAQTLQQAGLLSITPAV